MAQLWDWFHQHSGQSDPEEKAQKNQSSELQEWLVFCLACWLPLLILWGIVFFSLLATVPFLASCCCFKTLWQLFPQPFGYCLISFWLAVSLASWLQFPLPKAKPFGCSLKRFLVAVSFALYCYKQPYHNSFSSLWSKLVFFNSSPLSLGPP